MYDKALIEIKVDAKIEVHYHQHGDGAEHREILDKLDALAEVVKKMVENSTALNPKERKVLQKLVDDLEALAKPD